MSEIQPVQSTKLQLPQTDALRAVTASVKGGGVGGQLDTSSTITSMTELKAQAPELHTQMMESLARNICRDMKKHQDKIKKIMREGRNHS